MKSTVVPLVAKKLVLVFSFAVLLILLFVVTVLFLIERHYQGVTCRECFRNLNNAIRAGLREPGPMSVEDVLALGPVVIKGTLEEIEQQVRELDPWLCDVHFAEKVRFFYVPPDDFGVD